MQADNLRQEDVNKLAEAFKEIEQNNPEATLQIFSADQFEKKDCLFKDKCGKSELR